ncbi:putative GMC-type oxidoreductase [Paraburkholderia humisilvae]|uniref:Putative GMC-type oxidoreductase n=2 Tax=Paraburkholderia humisilvae TaxID=627669 RepID=A0A6J5EJB7_9BURK|nr:putative GMC-type oxidoreductase [Paraburkholderia humisilvae]
MNPATREFDMIVIGSGTCGATIARDLSCAGKRVLMLERGGNAPLKETLGGIVRIADQVKLGAGTLGTVRALTAGGSTAMYFGVVNDPPLDVFRALGIDLAGDFAAVRAELPIAPLPDALLSPQARHLADAARSLGHAWRKYDMLVDASRCASGYAYDAKWKARRYVEDAMRDGATLVVRANVERILIERGKAVGVVYRERRTPFGSTPREARAPKIVLAAGELASPQMLRGCGIEGIGARGFYCNPGYAIYGLVRGLRGTDGFVGCMGGELEDGIELGDANVVHAIHRPMMLGGMHLRHLRSFPETIGIGVKVEDTLSGRLHPDGRFDKQLGPDDLHKLDKGKRAAVEVLKASGARHIVDFGVTAAGRVGGLLQIGEHVDANLETSVRNLHVCDGSVIPDAMRGTPTLTLLCLAHYLSRRLLAP